MTDGGKGPKILVVGAGATGGYFGARLADAGRDVTFLVRPGRAALLRDGLQVISPLGDLTIRPRLLTAAELNEQFDVVLLTVKSFALEQAIDDMAPAVGPETIILPVLNGMRHMDMLRSRFGDRSVGGCAAKISTVVDDKGRIVHLSRMQEIAYGELDCSRSERITAVDNAMQGAVEGARLSEIIEQEMWEKWVFLAALGGTTCLMKGDVGEIVRVPNGHDFVLAFLDEVVRTVNAAGFPPRDAFLQNIRAMLTDPTSKLTSSMYRDMSEGGAIEADQIIGDLLRRAQSAGLETPLLAASSVQLSVYQARLARG